MSEAADGQVLEKPTSLDEYAEELGVRLADLLDFQAYIEQRRDDARRCWPNGIRRERALWCDCGRETWNIEGTCDHCLRDSRRGA